MATLRPLTGEACCVCTPCSASLPICGRTGVSLSVLCSGLLPSGGAAQTNRSLRARALILISASIGSPGYHPGDFPVGCPSRSSVRPYRRAGYGSRHHVAPVPVSACHRFQIDSFVVTASAARACSGRSSLVGLLLLDDDGVDHSAASRKVAICCSRRVITSRCVSSHSCS